jgi:tRNA threonylcarbamoyladenosine biosynthesis protein TsaE
MREPDQLSVGLADERATRSAGAALAAALAAAAADAALVTLTGELGTGKTTLVRGLLGALGVTGPVRSPTFTLLESYPVGPRTVHHLDWYRLAAGDLESLGFRDLLAPGNWVLVEWPERAAAVAARADLALTFQYEGGGRRLTLQALTATGRASLRRFPRTIA